MTQTPLTREEQREVIRRCQTDPGWFLTHLLGDDPSDYQVEILTTVRTHKRVAVKSANGVGKTWLAARGALWGLLTHYNARVITTAPTQRQVENLLWAEISGAWAKLQERWPGLFPYRLYEIPRLQISKEWVAYGFATNDPNALQGIHGPFVLIVFDEAGGNKGGVAPPMWAPLDGNLVGEDCHFWAIGNPTDPAVPFYQEFKDPSVAKFTVSAFDTPNFKSFGITAEDMRAGKDCEPDTEPWQEKITGPLPKPGLTTPEAVQAALRRYGEHSTWWFARVLGEFPEQSTDSLLWMSWVRDAIERGKDVGYPDAPPTQIDVGADIAAGGDNETVISAVAYWGAGSMPQQLTQDVSGFADTTHTRDQILGELLTLHLRYPDAAVSVRIDADGVGKGVHDMVAEEAIRRGWEWLSVHEMHNGQCDPAMPADYMNNRAWWWWAVREVFEPGTIAILEDEMLESQLTSIKWRETTAHRKIQIESKEDALKRGVASPDRADALMYALAPVSREAGMLVATPPPPPDTSITSFKGRLARSAAKRR